jgi:hypothetical protein
VGFLSLKRREEANASGTGYRKALKLVDSKMFGTGGVSLTYQPVGEQGGGFLESLGGKISVTRSDLPVRPYNRA